MSVTPTPSSSNEPSAYDMSLLSRSSIGSCILREIQAEIIHVDVVPKKSPGYVVLIRPTVGHFTTSLGALPTHTIIRTYSEWRTLYKYLVNGSNCTSRSACTCVLGSCPFWTMNNILKTISFPKKVLFQRYSNQLLQSRSHSLSHFISILLTKLQIYRPELFESSRTDTSLQEPPHNQQKCKFLNAIQTFLGLDDEIIRQFTNVNQKSRLKLNLHGWHSDRRNLYFLAAA